MKLEVCVDSLQSATNAVYNGADELEVCSSLNLGGLTPSLPFLKQVIDMVDLYVNSYPIHMSIEKPKINVMIRCHDGWDFNYSEKDLEKMLEDVRIFKDLPVDRFVFGALTDAKEIDEGSCKKIIEEASTKPVTFHRAFDRCKEPFRAMEDIIKIGFDRLLTSGMQETVVHEKAIDLLKVLLKNYGDKIDIMPGAGINVKNAHILINLGFKYIHGSFSRQIAFSSGDSVCVTDGWYVKKVKDRMKLNAEVINE